VWDAIRGWWQQRQIEASEVAATATGTDGKTYRATAYETDCGKRLWLREGDSTITYYVCDHGEFKVWK
jgi:hypothetical protein